MPLPLYPLVARSYFSWWTLTFSSQSGAERVSRHVCSGPESWLGVALLCAPTDCNIFMCLVICIPNSSSNLKRKASVQLGLMCYTAEQIHVTNMDADVASILHIRFAPSHEKPKLGRRLSALAEELPLRVLVVAGRVELAADACEPCESSECCERLLVLAGRLLVSLVHLVGGFEQLEAELKGDVVFE